MIFERIDKNYCLIFILVFLVLGTFLVSQPALFDVNIHNDDSRIILPAFFHLYGIDNFKDDPLNIASAASAPTGYYFLHYTLSNFIPIQVFPKVIQIVCLVFAAFFSFKIGFYYLNRLGGVLSLTSFLSAVWLVSIFGGGNPRAFGPTLYLALLYFLITKSRFGIMSVSFCSAFFYPQAMIVSVFCALINDAHSINKNRKDLKTYFCGNKKYYLILGFVYLLIFIVCINLSVKNKDVFGGFYSLDETLSHPSFSSEGRLGQVVPIGSSFKALAGSISLYYTYNQENSIFTFKEIIKKCETINTNDGSFTSNASIFFRAFGIDKFLKGWLKIVEWDYNRGAIVGLLLFFVVPSVLLFMSWFYLPFECVLFILVSICVYFLACAMAFHLYHPSRFISYPFSVISAQFFIIGIGSAYKKFNRLSYGAAIKMIVLLFAVMTVFSGAGIKLNNCINISVSPEQRGLYSFISEKTRSNAVFSGKAKEMDSLPLFTKRKVLINFELGFPWWKKINEEIVIPRLTAISKAYFSASVGVLRALRDDFNVDYIVVNKEDFSGESYPADFIFEPFSEIAKQEYERSKYHWFLKDPPIECIAYEDEKYIVVDMKKI